MLLLLLDLRVEVELPQQLRDQQEVLVEEVLVQLVLSKVFVQHDKSLKEILVVG